ncbi:ribosomal maturation YjgA family protein [Hymenobacter ruber]
MIRIRKRYLLAASLLFLLEVFIALFVHDKIIRPYAGDFLATIFLYCLARGLLKAAPGKVALGVLLTAYLIEGLQYVHLLSWLGWQHSRVARIVLGSQFEWIDMVAYTLGIGLVLGMEAGLGSISSGKITGPSALGQVKNANAG